MPTNFQCGRFRPRMALAGNYTANESSALRYINGELISVPCRASMGTELIYPFQAIRGQFPYRYAWNRMGRKGQVLRVLCRGKMNSCLVEFEDGFRAVTSRNALRKVKPL